MTVLTATLHVCSKHKPCAVKWEEIGGRKKDKKRNKDIKKEIENAI